MTAIVAALIAALAAITSAVITAKQNFKINETHKQVSENSHKNSPPTVLDLLSDVKDEQARTNARLEEHIYWHLDSKGKGK